MLIFLANLPWRNNGRFGVRAGSRWPFTSLPEKNGYIQYIPFPFFLSYATALLKKNGKEARLFDAIAAGIDEITTINQIADYNPGLIVIETSTPSFSNDMRLISDIKTRLKDSRIALCGPHASVFYKQILREYNTVDYILVGEYEYTLLDLVDCLENYVTLEGIHGLVYRDGNSIKINHSRRTINHLDDLPWPERGDVPIYKYNDGFANLPVPNVQMWGSRGCPFRCIFCLWPQAIYQEHRWRKRNYTDVVDEMEWLVKEFGFKAVYFDDDVFNIDKKHVLNICNEIIRKGINTPWAVMARVDLMDYEILEIMQAAGVYAIKYGIESANQDILDFCRKNMSLSKALRMVKLTKKLGIKVHLTFCLGMPGETRQTIQKTIDFIMEARPNSLQFSFATPFPGTELFQYAKEHNLLSSYDWSEYDGEHGCIVSGSELSSLDLEKITADFRDYSYASLNFAE